VWALLLACADASKGHPRDSDDGPAPDTGSSTVDTDSGSTDSAPPTDSADSTGTAPGCGDGACGSDESCWSCAADCGACDCPVPAEVLVYHQSAWNLVADAFLADPSPCADYYLHLPAVADHKLDPRGGGEPEAIRARGPRMHALAEFHWSTWAAAEGSPYDKGVAFRRAMEEAGYDVAAGDTWAVNELPSSVRSDPATRAEVTEVLRGLHEGDGVEVKGAVYVVGLGQGTADLSTYAANLEDWLQDAEFWEAVNLSTRWWAQEVYADPDWTCLPDATVAEVSTPLNHYVQHVARHAEGGPDSANTAQSYLGRAYTPLMNAVWRAGEGYGNTDVPLDTMQHFVSQQVYATRAWSTDHTYPDGRFGFAWARSDGVEDADLAVLAARLASAVHYAWDEGGGSAAGACSPSGAYTWCACEVEGAQTNPAWGLLGSW